MTKTFSNTRVFLICMIFGFSILNLVWILYNYFKGFPSKQSDNAVHERLPNIANTKNNLSNLLIDLDELRVLQCIARNSVQFLPMKRNNILSTAKALCRFWNYPLLFNHPHNLEYYLVDSFSQKQNKWMISETELTRLFIIPMIYPFTVSYCWKQELRQENWRIASLYMKDVATEIIKSNNWKENSGINFLIPASHPKSTLGNYEHPASNEFRQNAVFLRTDYDFSGNSQKDIIVPYYIDPTPLEAALTAICPQRYLLFFIGSDHPRDGLRQKIYNQLRTLNDPRIFFALSLSTAKAKYLSLMKSSEFCLVLRGDTASSARFFEIIAMNCIPVIISDHIIFPFQFLINYTKFTIHFPESIAHNITHVISYLQTIKSLEKQQYHQFIEEVQPLLLYRLPFRQYSSSYNPTNLIVLEAIYKLKLYCQRFPVPIAPVCANLEQRMNISHTT